MAKRKIFVPTLKPITPDNRKKFEAIMKSTKKAEVTDKYSLISVSKVYVTDEDMKL